MSRNSATVAKSALEKIHDRVSVLVFLDAHLPQNGDRGIYTSNHQTEIIADRNASKAGIDPPQASEFTEKHISWVRSMMTPHPIGVYLQPILLGARASASSTRTICGRPATAASASMRAERRPDRMAGTCKTSAARTT